MFFMFINAINFRFIKKSYLQTRKLPRATLLRWPAFINISLTPLTCSIRPHLLKSIEFSRYCFSLNSIQAHAVITATFRHDHNRLRSH